MNVHRPSRYHVAKQNDGRGWMLLRLAKIGSSKAVILATCMTEQTARDKLAEYRAVESFDAEHAS